MRPQLELFGSPTLTSSALPFERRGQLVAYLALKRAWVGRAELAALLWPGQESKLAYTNLRKTLFRLQSAPWAPGIETQGGALRLEVDTDVALFEAALREGRVADAVQLRRGELLAGFDDDANEAWSSWLAYERDRLRVAWRGAALARLEDEIEPAEGIELSTRLLDLDPLDETALRLHMAILARDGQGSRARQAYRTFAERLAQDLGLSPGAELRALHDTLVNAAPAAAPPSREIAADPGFVGRVVELRRMADLLARDDCRLLTILGPGGAGKTRLARHALPQLGDAYGDGTAFVALEDVESEREIGGRLARDLGVALTGNSDPLDQAIGFLRPRQMLVVLDNFEQLAAHAAVIERLLNEAPRVRVIATSRVRLALAAERLLPVEGLPCPEPEDSDRAESFDAVRLFVQAAQRVEPALVPAVETQAIVDICRQVEGLPLAIEIAAAWTRVLSCAAIAAELRQGSEILRAVDAAQPARHASMDVVFDHSWRLLTVPERAALARLSVFREGFTADAARSIAGVSLPVLGALADKSLLRKEGTRIFLHPLVQQLAARRLADDESRDATERAHAHHYHRLLVQLRDDVERGDRMALEALDTELPNCRVAWRWAIAHDAGDALLRCAPAFHFYFEYRCRLEEGVALLSDARATAASRANPALHALLAGSMALLEFRRERYPAAIAAAEEGRAAARQARDATSHALCLQVLGVCAMRKVRLDEAHEHLQQGLRHALAGSEPRRAAVILHNMALLERLRGRQDEALRLFTEALARQRSVGDFVGEAMCLGNLALLYADRKEFPAALAHLTEALAIAERQGLVSMRLLMLSNLTGITLDAGDVAAAEDYGQRALALARETGNRNTAAFLELQFVRLAVRRGDLPAARANLESAMRIAIAIGRPALLFEGINCFGELLAAQGETGCARLVLGFVAEHPLVNVPDREAARERMAQSPAQAGVPHTWPGIEVDELANRIVLEAGSSHAPLIAALRAAR